jgi:hypothetical protein
MVACNVLCMDAVGEKPLIPREINQLCQKLQSEGKIDSQSSLAYLQSSTNLEGVPVDPSKCDPALRFFADVLRLCEMENRAIEKGFGACWSPLISSSLVWFIGNFINSYLYVEATYYFASCSFIYRFTCSVSTKRCKQLVYGLHFKENCFQHAQILS